MNACVDGYARACVCFKRDERLWLPVTEREREHAYLVILMDVPRVSQNNLAPDVAAGPTSPVTV